MRNVSDIALYHHSPFYGRKPRTTEGERNTMSVGLLASPPCFHYLSLPNG